MGKYGQYGALVGLLLAGPAGAGCRLALALGFDVSRSIDARDYEIQRQGLMAALQAADIRRAFLVPPDPVAVTLFEWSGKADQRVILPWVMVESAADLDAMVMAIGGHVRGEQRLPTGLGAALSFGRALLANAPVCAAMTLDMAGDGQSNDGPSPERIYATVDFAGVTVNGLAIGDHERDITRYYETEVIRGPGAFVEPAPSQKDFPRAIRRKLQRELETKLLGDAGSPPAYR